MKCKCKVRLINENDIHHRPSTQYSTLLRRALFTGQSFCRTWTPPQDKVSPHPFSFCKGLPCRGLNSSHHRPLQQIFKVEAMCVPLFSLVCLCEADPLLLSPQFFPLLHLELDCLCLLTMFVVCEYLSTTIDIDCLIKLDISGRSLLLWLKQSTQRAEFRCQRRRASRMYLAYKKVHSH